jgi:hypothetical protein
MDQNPVSRKERLAKASRLLGVISISIPSICLVFLYLFRDDREASLNVNLIIYDAMIYGGMLFGLPGYILYAIVQRKVRVEGAENQITVILSAGRTLCIIGILITLLFLCTAVNSGFAF